MKEDILPDTTPMHAADDSKAKINSNDWNSMSLEDLLEQKNIMLNRYYVLLQMEKNPKEILIGIEKLEALISQKF